jgi:hypothetical protein
VLGIRIGDSSNTTSANFYPISLIKVLIAQQVQ